MAPGDATLPATRRTRRSIGAHTDVNKAFEKENATTDVTSSLAANRKKSRSKSLGPGGLDALMKTNGNRRAVRHDSCYSYLILYHALINSVSCRPYESRPAFNPKTNHANSRDTPLEAQTTGPN
jgi:hypothetical protein